MSLTIGSKNPFPSFAEVPKSKWGKNAPMDQLQVIHTFQSGEDLAKASRVCKLWNRSSSNMRLWEIAFKRDFGYLPPLKKGENYKVLYEKRVVIIKNLIANRCDIPIAMNPIIACSHLISCFTKNALIIDNRDGSISIFDTNTGLKKFDLDSFPISASPTLTKLTKESPHLFRDTDKNPLCGSFGRIDLISCEDDLFLAHGGSIISFWKPSSGECVFAHPYVLGLVKYFDNKVIYECTHNNLEVAHIYTHTLLDKFKLPASFSTDVHCQSVGNILILYADSIVGRDIKERKPLFEINFEDPGENYVSEISHPDFFVHYNTSQSQPEINVSDIRTGKLIRKFKTTAIVANLLNFPICLSGEFCVGRSENDRNKLNLWNITNGELIRTFEAPKNEAPEDGTIYDMFMHKDRLITKSRNGIIKIWDIHTGKVVSYIVRGNVEGFIDENIMGITTPSSTPLFTEANTLSFWDIRSGTCLVACPMLQGVPRLELNPKLLKGKVFIHFTKELTDKELKDFNEKNGTVLRSQRVRGLIEERRHQIILRDYSRLHEKTQPSRCVIC